MRYPSLSALGGVGTVGVGGRGTRLVWNVDIPSSGRVSFFGTKSRLLSGI